MKKPTEDPISGIFNELASGLVYVHTRLDDNTARTVNNAAKLAALIDILVEKGLLDAAEVEERSKQILLNLMDVPIGGFVPVLETLFEVSNKPVWVITNYRSLLANIPYAGRRNTH